MKSIIARKEHRCTLCHLEIDKGETYFAESYGPWNSNGDPWTLKLHSFCKSIYNTETDDWHYSDWDDCTVIIDGTLFDGYLYRKYREWGIHGFMYTLDKWEGMVAGSLRAITKMGKDAPSWAAEWLAKPRPELFFDEDPRQ